MNENNFEFHGIPSNDEIEVPEKVVKQSKGFRIPSSEDIRKITSSDIEEIKKALPKEFLNLMSSMGTDPDTIINQALSMMEGLDEEQLKNMLNGSSISFSTFSLDDNCQGNCSSCNNCDDEDMTIDEMFPTGNPKYLFPEDFGSIECQTSENLYDEFIAVYGTDSTKYLDDNVGLRNFLLNDITAKLNFDHIKNMRFVNSTNNFILFYMEPESETDYGFYAAVIKLPDNTFAVYIPTYCNTFDMFEDEDSDEDYLEVMLFNEDDQDYAFDGHASDITSFKFLAANLIEFAVSFVLAPTKKTLITPKEFGTIRTTRASVFKDSSFFPIGKITSNKSVSATLLLKDAELPLDADNYNIFMKFPKVVDEHMLRFLSGILFNVDFNNCKLLENVELKYTSDGKLYFDIDHLGDL